MASDLWDPLTLNYRRLLRHFITKLDILNSNIKQVMGIYSLIVFRMSESGFKRWMQWVIEQVSACP